MDNNELENDDLYEAAQEDEVIDFGGNESELDVEGDQSADGDGNSTPWAWIIALLSSLAFGGIGWFRSRRYKRKYKQEREKNALYQKMLIKHQAEINALKTEKEKKEYRDRLWEAIISGSEDDSEE